MEAIVSCENLTFRYPGFGEPVFSGVSFSVARGEAVLLMGPSGCGKSTLAHCLAGLYPEYGGALDGDIRMEGTPVAGLTPARRAGLVSIMFQNPDNQFCMGRVDHEILFALENIAYQGDMEARTRELLGLVGLSDVASAPIHTLSGGTKQKIALATALATQPQVLVLDEPFANIDPEACAELSERLAALHRAGLTLFIVDHKADWWLPFLSRVMLMDADGTLSHTDIAPGALSEHRAEFRARGLFLGDEWLEGRRPPDPPKAAESAVEANNLSVRYEKKTVLLGLSFSIQKGVLTALIGRNGTGKSTLLSAIAGVAKHKGELILSGRAGLVFQNPRYQFLTLRVREEILFTLRHSAGGGPADPEAEADRLLAEFGLSGYADASPYTLSQGQQRRLAILSMVAGDRPILLLDEPTYAQDEQATRFIMELLAARVAQGLTAVIATHDHALARAFAGRILRLEDGKLTEERGESGALRLSS